MPHYLPANRFEWWQTWTQMANVAPSGAVNDDARAGEEGFHDEYLPDLATVVGAALPTALMQRNRRAYVTASWDNLADGASPNGVPGIGFTFVTRAPRSVPVVRAINVRTIDAPAPNVVRKVVVNEAAPADPDRPAAISRNMRPGLEIVFDQPQRSVGLEFGYVAPDDPTGNISSWSVRLIAKDRDGIEVARSYGSSQFFNNALIAYRVDHRIGVRDAAGRISSVELQFTHPYANAPHLVDLERRLSWGERWIPYPQVIHRVWHEPLPPAAVIQGSAYEEQDADGNVVASGDTLTLPFHCDQAVVFLRGFGLEYPDTPRRIYRMQVGAALQWLSDRSIMVRGTGWLMNDEAPAYPLRARADYTVLAWNSRSVDLRMSRATATLAPAEESGSEVLVALVVGGTIAYGPVGTLIGAVAGGAASTDTLAIDPASSGFLQVADPCPWASAASPEEASARCGGLFGGLTGFGFQFPGRSQDVVKLWWGSDPRGPRRDVDGATPVLRWAHGSYVEGDDDGSVPSHIHGLVLTGRALTPAPAPDPFRAGLRQRGPRAPEEFQETEDRTDGLGFGEVNGLIAAPALAFFYFEPDDWVRQLDVEIKGTNYNGATVDWRMGGGIAVKPPGEDDGGGTCAATPSFAAVTRTPYHAAPRLVSESVRFEGSVVGTRDYVPELPRTGGDSAPDQVGVLRNDGDAPALVTAARMAGPHRADFNLRLFVDRRPWQRVGWAAEEAAGRVFAVHETRRFPILLWPGERIIIAGSFRPGVVGLRWAAVEFETNDRSRGVVSVEVVGQSGPNLALGQVVTWNRGWRAAVGTAVTVRAIVTSDGQTPLVIAAIRIEDASSGFAITGTGPHWIAPGGGAQIDPGNTHHFSVTFAPNRVGLVRTRIIAETNAGLLTTPLEGEGT